MLRTILFIFMISIFCAAGCGQKGPLIHPDDQKNTQKDKDE